MLIQVRPRSVPHSSEITPYSSYITRRDLVYAAGGMFLTGSVGKPVNAINLRYDSPGLNSTIQNLSEGYSKLNIDDNLTPYSDVVSYNNFYEFGLGKTDPNRLSKSFKPIPWSVKIDGECAKPGQIDFEEILSTFDIEERIYRMRCVEAWSMVIPWVGISLAQFIKRFEPLSTAKFVRFETVFRPDEMPGQKSRRILPWPYIEGLRLDEAMNPLAILAVGLYGEVLPKQNGAPIRLVVPWKYGFKSIKSIVRISFTRDMPRNTWNIMAPQEYGFYANVNPDVDHPRWSQSRERRIGDFFRRPTLKFNGYTEEVAHLYSGMNLKRNY